MGNGKQRVSTAPAGKSRDSTGRSKGSRSALTANSKSSKKTRGYPAGVPINREEFQQAFKFFDVDKKGYLTTEDMKSRLPLFYKNMPTREMRFLMNNKQKLHFNELYELLADNHLTNFDPVEEAFKVYDPNATGFVDTEILRDVFSRLGFGNVSDEDLTILVETADVDCDGKINLSGKVEAIDNSTKHAILMPRFATDFRSMLAHKVDLGVFNEEH